MLNFTDLKSEVWHTTNYTGPKSMISFIPSSLWAMATSLIGFWNAHFLQAENILPNQWQNGSGLTSNVRPLMIDLNCATTPYENSTNETEGKPRNHHKCWFLWGNFYKQPSVKNHFFIQKVWTKPDQFTLGFLFLNVSCSFNGTCCFHSANKFVKLIQEFWTIINMDLYPPNIPANPVVLEEQGKQGTFQKQGNHWIVWFVCKLLQWQTYHTVIGVCCLWQQLVRPVILNDVYSGQADLPTRIVMSSVAFTPNKHAEDIKTTW